ncbi:MAG: hypothetical protein GXP63_07675 [DPANN group archaeon]|nr:hypothetical protein [DPANN group archaeon]
MTDHAFLVSSNQYFEGTLQLRNPSDACVQFINDQLKASRQAWIAKVTRVREGYDLYLSSQHFLQGLGKKLHQAFGGTLKVSQTLHTFHRQKSKLLYRVTVFYSCPTFSRGDVILAGEDHGCPVLVRKIGKVLSGVDVRTGRRRSFRNYDPEAEVLPQYDAPLIKTKPHLEILDPVSFQNEPLHLDGKLIIASSAKVMSSPAVPKTVRVVAFGGWWYLVPLTKLAKKDP